jgi:hypothetical protein
MSSAKLTSSTSVAGVRSFPTNCAATLHVPSARSNYTNSTWRILDYPLLAACCLGRLLLGHEGWHNTVIKVDCSATWGWPFIGVLLVCTAVYILSGVYGTQYCQRPPVPQAFVTKRAERVPFFHSQDHLAGGKQQGWVRRQSIVGKSCDCLVADRLLRQRFG